MDVLARFLEFLLITAFWGGVGLSAMMLVRLGVFVAQRRALRTAARTVNPRPARWSASASWSLTLLVHVEQDGRLFRPSVQLRGSSLPGTARLRLELVDEHGAKRIARERSVPRSALGTEFVLPSFAAPDDASVEDVLRWHWDVALQDWRGVQARWREHPLPAGALNGEAELEVPGVVEV